MDEITREELLHAEFRFVSSDGGSLGGMTGLVSFRQLASREAVVLFVDYFDYTRDECNILNFFHTHRNSSISAQILSMKGQSQPVTCFNCRIASPYVIAEDTMNPFGIAGRLIEIVCDSYLEDHLISSPQDMFKWRTCRFDLYGLHILSGANEDTNYSVTFRNRDVEIVYSYSQSDYARTSMGNYRFICPQRRCTADFTFLRDFTFEDLVHYVDSYMSFLSFVFSVSVSCGPLISKDEPMEFETNRTKYPPRFWLKRSRSGIREPFEVEYLQAVFSIDELESAATRVFSRWNDIFTRHPLSVTAMERINRNPVSDVDYMYDVASLVRALDDLTIKNAGDKRYLSARLVEVLDSIGEDCKYCFDGRIVEKLCEVRHSDAHSREVRESRVSMYEMPALRDIAIKVFKAHMKKYLLS